MGDYYTLQSPWYWVIQVFMIIYGLSFIAYGVVILNTSVTHTYFPGTQVNELYSQRYVSTQWYALLFAASHVLMFPFVMIMITFRRSHGCSVVWFSIIFTLAVMSWYTVIVLGMDYIRCNNPEPDQRNNLCSDKRRCCAPEVNAHVANGCPLATSVTCKDLPTIVSVNNLHPDTDFLWVFWPNFIYMIADTLIVSFFVGIFCISPFPKKQNKNRSPPKPSAPPADAQEQDDEEKVTLPRKKPPQEAFFSQPLKYTKPE